MMLALLCLSLPGEAGVKPGDFITPENSAQVKISFHRVSSTESSTA